MLTSKLTIEAQTTIPQPVRIALHLHPGDELVYQIQGQYVLLSKAPRGVIDYAFSTFHEWDSQVDQRAYAKL